MLIAVWSLIIGVYFLCFVGGKVAITGRVPNHLAGPIGLLLEKLKLCEKPRKDSI
jgi:hypothetical protein